jgi:hypothetical protein
MMISHEVDFDATYQCLSRLHRSFECLSCGDGDISVRSSLLAVFRAKEMKWIDFRETFDLGCKDASIQIDEYMHYAR